MFVHPFSEPHPPTRRPCCVRGPNGLPATLTTFLGQCGDHGVAGGGDGMMITRKRHFRKHLLFITIKTDCSEKGFELTGLSVQLVPLFSLPCLLPTATIAGRMEYSEAIRIRRVRRD